MPQVLIVEDQPNLVRSLGRSLEEAGCTCLLASSLQAARRDMSSTVKLIVLDRMLPDGDGLEWVQELRSAGNRTPVLVLTARDSIPDRVAGLDAGADDYLVKPFALEELLARIRALLRRDPDDTATTIRCGNLVVDLIARTATRDSRQLALRNRQFELLAFLIRHKNEVVTRDMIASEVWRQATATWTNVIEVHINHLRKELERPGLPTLLHTIRGQGYLLGDAP